MAETPSATPLCAFENEAGFDVREGDGALLGVSNGSWLWLMINVTNESRKTTEAKIAAKLFKGLLRVAGAPPEEGWSGKGA